MDRPASARSRRARCAPAAAAAPSSGPGLKRNSFARPAPTTMRSVSRSGRSVMALVPRVADDAVCMGHLRAVVRHEPARTSTRSTYRADGHERDDKCARHAGGRRGLTGLSTPRREAARRSQPTATTHASGAAARWHPARSPTGASCAPSSRDRAMAPHQRADQASSGCLGCDADTAALEHGAYDRQDKLRCDVMKQGHR